MYGVSEVVKKARRVSAIIWTLNRAENCLGFHLTAGASLLPWRISWARVSISCRSKDFIHTAYQSIVLCTVAPTPMTSSISVQNYKKSNIAYTYTKIKIELKSLEKFFCRVFTFFARPSAVLSTYLIKVVALGPTSPK